MTNIELLIASLQADPKVLAAVFYGSRINDNDFLIFVADKEWKFKPEKVWNRPIWQGAEQGVLAVVGEDLFDLNFTVAPYDEARFVKLADMLRNSDPSPTWLKDSLNLEANVAAHTAAKGRKQMTSDEILGVARQIYINARFLTRKVWNGSLYGRHLISGGFQSHLFSLAREVDLRRGGKGLHRGKDAEITFSPAEIEMLTVCFSSEPADMAEALVKVRIQTRFWLKMLEVEIPEFICKPW